METKQFTCIECPKSCVLTVDIENCKMVKVSGNLCPKGAEYAKDEVENPLRMFTATVLTEGLVLKMVPVRTDKAIPKLKVLDAAEEVKRLRIKSPLHVGDVIVKDFLRLGVNLIATRDAV
jgi:CxxC motif-containing protein